jgi:hypothetical protein
LPKVSDSALFIQHADCFEVRSEDGSIVRQFAFDNNARRRDLGEDDQETSFPSRQDLCWHELYGRNGEAVDLSGYSFCQACAARGADVRPDLDWDKQSKARQA